MFDYLLWRGDIPFSQLPLNPVDALIFSALSYVSFENVVPDEAGKTVTLREAALAILEAAAPESLVRVKKDLELLEAAAKTERFGTVELDLYRSILIPEEETQFAAMACHMSDGTAYLAYRGTDHTLVGWKEDFNMAFQEQIPSQQLALEYLQDFAKANRGPIWMGGHSKGGNLAVYAAAKADHLLQSRIIMVYNQDGPGFSEAMMEDPGYQSILPKLRTLVPQSSVIGMLLEHEEPYTIVKSSQIGVMQHELYSWEVMGGDFIQVEELTADSRFLDRTFKNWLAGMSREERNEFFDTVFDLLGTGGVRYAHELIQPQNVRNYLKTLKTNEYMRNVIASELASLIQSARAVQETPET